MNIRKIIQRRIRLDSHGVRVEGDVNAAVAGNVGDRGSVTQVSSTQSVKTTPPSRRKEDEWQSRNTAS